VGHGFLKEVVVQSFLKVALVSGIFIYVVPLWLFALRVLFLMWRDAIGWAWRGKGVMVWQRFQMNLRLKGYVI